MMDLATWRSKETLMRAVSMESWGWNLFEQVDEKMEMIEGVTTDNLSRRPAVKRSRKTGK